MNKEHDEHAKTKKKTPTILQHMSLASQRSLDGVAFLHILRVRWAASSWWVDHDFDSNLATQVGAQVQRAVLIHFILDVLGNVVGLDVATALSASAWTYFEGKDGGRRREKRGGTD